MSALRAVVLDTNVVKRLYVPGPLRRSCRALRTRHVGRCYVAEVTTLEIVSALADEVRIGKITLQDFRKANDAFIEDLATGRIEVREFLPRDYIKCRSLLAAIGASRGRHIRSHDAMIAFVARELALQLGSAVSLVTCDRKFAKTVASDAAFEGLVDVRLLDEPVQVPQAA